MNFIAGWAYEETILAHTQPTQKCLKFEYLSQIEYDFKNLMLQALRIRFLPKKR